MATPAERREKIAGIRALPARVQAAVGELSEAQLDLSGGEGEWNLRQIVHHLADAHMNIFVRLKLTLTEERPTLKSFNQDDWARLPDTTTAPIAASLSILSGVHQRACILLESVPESAWRRPAFHTEAGELTLDDLLSRLAQHGETHLMQIAAGRNALGL